MPRRFTDRELWELRTELPLSELLKRLRRPYRRRAGHLAFVCPKCGESRSDLNPQENLLRCFHCETNFNPIDFTMAARECDFVGAVLYLLGLQETLPQ